MRNLVLIIATTLLISACGGGGGSAIPQAGSDTKMDLTGSDRDSFISNCVANISSDADLSTLAEMSYCECGVNYIEHNYTQEEYLSKGAYTVMLEMIDVGAVGACLDEARTKYPN